MVDFNLIKQRIQRFSRSSQVEQCIHLCVECERTQPKTYPFWYALVLLRWNLLYAKDSPFRSTATRQDVIDTLRLIEKFEVQWPVVKFNKGIERGLRIIAFQQFWVQDSIHSHTFGRQLVLFSQLKGSLDLEAEFLRLTGMSIVSFLR